MTKFEKQFPGLTGKFGNRMTCPGLPDRVEGQYCDWCGTNHTITFELFVNLMEYCLDKTKVKQAIEAAIHGVMFPGYDENSEKALCEMQTYIYKELKLDDI